MSPVLSIANEVRVPAPGGAALPGTLIVPESARGIVVFAHGSGSSRTSPRNATVAKSLRARGLLGTLLFDLLTPQEDLTQQNRFDIETLTDRLVAATLWLAEEPVARDLSLGFFGASTGAAAALRAAANLGSRIEAVVSRGGRPDLAMDELPRVTAPTMLIVGGADRVVLEFNRLAFDQLGGAKQLEVVPGATHLFEEPGALEHVADLASEWFETYLAKERL